RRIVRSDRIWASRCLDSRRQRLGLPGAAARRVGQRGGRRGPRGGGCRLNWLPASSCAAWAGQVGEYFLQPGQAGPDRVVDGVELVWEPIAELPDGRVARPAR